VLGSNRIVTSPAGYLLRVEPGELDLERFEDGVGRTGLESIREALLLWRGPALADFAHEPWAAAPIIRIEELRRAAIEKRIDADLALGRHAELVPELAAQVREHPLRERASEQLMLALYRSGRQAEALEAYQATRRALVDELGLEPGPSLKELEQAILRHDSSLDLEHPVTAQRSILVFALDETRLDALLAFAEPLAKDPPRELILARSVLTGSDLAAASADLHRQRERLLAAGIGARAAVFTSRRPARDATRIATEQDVDLILVDGPAALLDDPVLSDVLAAPPCDVAVALGGEPARGSVLVAFTGAAHDWSAVEIGAWFARAHGVTLRLAGPTEDNRDASGLLADASLAVQRALGVAAEPLLVPPGTDGLLRASEDAAIVVVGLSDRWRKEGLGQVRAALAVQARAAVLLVRHGLRPGGLAPPASRTRFTWSNRTGYLAHGGGWPCLQTGSVRLGAEVVGLKKPPNVCTTFGTTRKVRMVSSPRLSSSTRLRKVGAIACRFESSRIGPVGAASLRRRSTAMSRRSS
jgi:Bacterial transcriptional activator domain